MERITLAVGGTRREYLLFAPAVTGPLVVFLHGTGATAAWADDETGWSRLAEREGFALMLPQALSPHPDQPPKFLTNPPQWQDSAGTEDLDFLAFAMDDAAKRTGTDPRRVFVTGFSNGGAMAFRVATVFAERVAAVAPVAGHCALPDPKPARPVPTLYVVGSTDPLIPLRGGDVRSPWQHRYVRRPPVVETLEKWARAIGCDATPTPPPNPPAPFPAREGGEDGSGLSPPSLAGKGAGGLGLLKVDAYPGPVLFQSVVIEGLGHHWPGGKGQFNHRIAGPPVDTVNGTELVWEFFKQQM